MVDRRLGEFAFERRGLEHRIEGLDSMAVAHACADAAVSETAGFLQRLPDLLRSDDPEERQAAIRRCVEGVVIDRDAGRAVVAVRRVPTGPALPDRLPTTPRRAPISISRSKTAGRSKVRPAAHLAISGDRAGAIGSVSISTRSHPTVIG